MDAIWTCRTCGQDVDPLPTPAVLDATHFLPVCKPEEHWPVYLRESTICRRCGVTLGQSAKRLEFRRA